jgi:hypothetical protein
MLALRLFSRLFLMMTTVVLLSCATTVGMAKDAEVKVPRPKGERYEAEVPDTLDLAERGRIAINGLTGAVNAKHNYDQYFLSCLASDPPYMVNMHIGDVICTAKWDESLPMMRIMSGSEQNLDIEQKMMQAMVSALDPEDGLHYIPKEDTAKTSWMLRSGYPIADEDLSSLILDGRLMLAMITWYERDQDPVWLGRIQKMADGLGKIAIYKDDYAFYPEGKVGIEFSYLKESGYKYTDEPESDREGSEGSVLVYQGQQIRALTRWYEMSGDKKALELARKLSNFVIKRKMWEADTHSEWIDGPGHGNFSGHFHGHHISSRGVLEYAHVANDQRLKEFVRDCYEYSRSWGLGRIGTFGDGTHKAHTEGCSIADMVGLAIRLSDFGVGDYWDDVDQYVRNQATEAQFLRKDLLEKVAKATSKYPEAYQQYATDTKKPPPWGPALFKQVLDRTAPQVPETNNVIERNLGLFPFFSLPTCIPYPVQGGCCSGNLTNALYYAWESIVRFKDGVAHVNLLLNRASPWLDINSHLPYEGKVVIRNKKARKLVVRIPRWVDRKAVKCTVNQKDAGTYWTGNFLVLDKIRKKDVVTIEFPMVEQTIKYVHPFDKEYTISFKGNTVVDIAPRETNPTAYPLYLRDHFKKNAAPIKKVTRYVSPVMLDW